MIIVRLLSPEPFWLVWHHQSLLGPGSRHCHGINYTNDAPGLAEPDRATCRNFARAAASLTLPSNKLSAAQYCHGCLQHTFPLGCASAQYTSRAGLLLAGESLRC